MNLDPALDKVKKIIETTGGKIKKEENDGKKRLAYSINGQSFAIYYYFDLELPVEAPAKISSSLNIADEVLRYLLVKTDERKVKLAARRNEKTTSEPTDEANNEITPEKGE